MVISINSWLFSRNPAISLRTEPNVAGIIHIRFDSVPFSIVRFVEILTPLVVSKLKV